MPKDKAREELNAKAISISRMVEAHSLALVERAYGDPRSTRKKSRLASLGFNVREARPLLGLCPATAPRRPAGVAKDIALLPLKDWAKPRYPTRKGARGAHFSLRATSNHGEKTPML